MWIRSLHWPECECEWWVEREGVPLEMGVQYVRHGRGLSLLYAVNGDLAWLGTPQQPWWHWSPYHTMSCYPYHLAAPLQDPGILAARWRCTLVQSWTEEAFSHSVFQFLGYDSHDMYVRTSEAIAMNYAGMDSSVLWSERCHSSAQTCAVLCGSNEQKKEYGRVEVRSSPPHSDVTHR